jgi:hypothetical protein
MINMDEEKNQLTNELSEQYSQNIINMAEYERILEYINKIETVKEINIIEKIIQENTNKENNELMLLKNSRGEKHLALFAWRSSNVKPINGNGGKYLSLFGANRIIIEDLPQGRTVLNINSIFGLTEIIISKKIKVINKAVPIFAGIFAPGEINDVKSGEEVPELYIMGKAIFGNITIIRR